MHWVKATSPNGEPTYLNLDAIPQMMPGMMDEKPVTVLFLGGVAAKIDGGLVYARTLVVETIPELFLLPRIMASPICKSLPADATRAGAGAVPAPTPGAPSIGAASTARVPNVEGPERFPPVDYEPYVADVAVTRKPGVPIYPSEPVTEPSFPDPGSSRAVKNRDRFKAARAAVRRTKR
jgi:hypothetical protein